MKPISSLLCNTSATFSSCRLYRYDLRRRWDDGPTLHFCMLNPSTADEVQNDPTVERCQRRAALLGFNSLIVTNIFAWRSTDPMALYDLADPIGPNNDTYITEACNSADMTICGWGGHGDLRGRGRHVELMLRRAAVPLHYLKLSKDGRNPYHPLYLGYDVKPQEWK